MAALPASLLGDGEWTVDGELGIVSMKLLFSRKRILAKTWHDLDWVQRTTC